MLLLSHLPSPAMHNSSYFPHFPLLVFTFSTNLKLEGKKCREICYTELFSFWGIIRCADGS